MRGDRVRYFSSYDEDFVETKNQNCTLPDDYKWIREDLFSKVISRGVYLISLLLSFVWCKLFLHVKIVNKDLLKKASGTGGFIFANHTQPVGDVFIPAHAAFPNRIYTLASVANFGIPVVGKQLVYLGALPVPKRLRDMKKLGDAIEKRILEKRLVVIYPEAHVWEYYSGIRPFTSVSFTYPVKLNVPVFTMTSTYQKSRFFKKPKMTVWVDGPFYPDPTLDRRERTEELCRAVRDKMIERSRKTNCEYIRYVKK